MYLFHRRGEIKQTCCAFEKETMSNCQNMNPNSKICFKKKAVEN